MLRSTLSQFKFRGLLISIIAVLIVLIYNSNAWSSIVNYIASTQLEFHKLLNEQVMQAAQRPEVYGFTLIGISFVYGVFHALGPGHGKAVIVSYLASHPQSKLRSCLLAFAAAMFQALTAILLVTSLSLVLKHKYSDIEVSASQFSLIGYGLLLALGSFIALKSIRQLYRAEKAHSHTSSDHSGHNHSHSSCGSCCSTASVEVEEKSLYQLLTVAMAIGLRPCSGALIILVTSSLLGIYHFGILGTLAMSLGTAASTCIIALASQYARDFLQKTLTVYTDQRQHQRYGLYLQLAGSIVIVLLAWALIDAHNTLTNPIL